MTNFDEELRSMDEGLRRLKIEYHIFFNGNRKTPPEDLRLRLEWLAKQLSERSGMTQAQRFRYNTLLTRYYTYRSLWRRMLQEREKGRDLKSNRVAQSTEPSLGARQPIEGVRISITNPKAEEDKVRNLYEAFVRVRRGINSGESPVSFQQFAKYIAAQTRTIRNKSGCISVAYSVAMKKGSVRLTASAENP
jgi:hypothetical protein